jgi:Family of unknown function (DUF6088)
MKPETLETRLLKRIDRKGGDVFLRADFEDLDGYDQVGRALRRIVREGRLVRVGQGLYARAEAAPSDGRPIPTKGFRAMATEALSRLGVETVPTRLEQAYNAGRTTQVPSGRVVGVRKRVRRKIGYDGIFVGFERAGPGPG